MGVAGGLIARNGKILNRTIGDCQAGPRIENDPVRAGTPAVECQSAQYDGVVRSCADGDGIPARCRNYTRLDTVRTGDCDCLGDVVARSQRCRLR